jgi:hypothetical protein
MGRFDEALLLVTRSRNLVGGVESCPRRICGSSNVIGARCRKRFRRVRVRLRFGSGRRCEGSAVLCKFAVLVLKTGIVIVPAQSSDARFESRTQLCG